MDSGKELNNDIHKILEESHELNTERSSSYLVDPSDMQDVTELF